jgi:hypothetical protein
VPLLHSPTRGRRAVKQRGPSSDESSGLAWAESLACLSPPIMLVALPNPTYLLPPSFPTFLTTRPTKTAPHEHATPRRHTPPTHPHTARIRVPPLANEPEPLACRDTPHSSWHYRRHLRSGQQRRTPGGNDHDHLVLIWTVPFGAVLGKDKISEAEPSWSQLRCMCSVNPRVFDVTLELSHSNLLTPSALYSSSCIVVAEAYRWCRS